MKIAELRKEKGLTQSQLAQLLHVYQSTMSNWENGVTQPDIESLIKIADILEVSIDELLDRTINGIVHTNANLTADEEQLLLVYRKLNHQNKSQTLGFAKGLFSNQ